MRRVLCWLTGHDEDPCGAAIGPDEAATQYRCRRCGALRWHPERLGGEIDDFGASMAASNFAGLVVLLSVALLFYGTIGVLWLWLRSSAP